MPIIVIIMVIVSAYILYKLVSSARKGGGIARYILGGGMIVSLLLASRIFGARILYAFLPSIGSFMAGGDDKSYKHEGADIGSDRDIMSKKEAALILGLDINANKSEVNSAYKNLMQKLHPDKGGNDYLASKLNKAREIMLS